MWLSAEERHKHRQALCKWLLHDCNPCEECNIRVVPMVRIRHHIPEAKQRKPEAGAASVIYNATRLILRQRVRGSARAVRAVRNTRVFQTETRVVVDVEMNIYS